MIKTSNPVKTQNKSTIHCLNVMAYKSTWIVIWLAQPKFGFFCQLIFSNYITSMIHIIILTYYNLLLNHNRTV